MIVTVDNGMITEGEQPKGAIGAVSAESTFTPLHAGQGHDKTKGVTICALCSEFVAREVRGHPALRLALRR